MKPARLLVLAALALCGCSVTSSLSSSSKASSETSSEAKTSSEDSSVEPSSEPEPSSSLLPQTPRIYASPLSETVTRLDTSFSNAGALALEQIAFGLEGDGNAVISPASYLLAIAGVNDVSTNMDVSFLGLEKGDAKKLLEAWNYHYERPSDNYASAELSEMKSLLLHQQIGDAYRFAENKRRLLAEEYESTMVSSLDSYHEDAIDFFHNDAGFTIEPPDPHATADGIITYGAFKMKDCVADDFGSSQRPFNGKDVECYSFGSTRWPEYWNYAKADNYCVFEFNVAFTSLMVILPDAGTELEDISLSEAYRFYNENKKVTTVVGYVPYFHVASQNVDLTSALSSHLSGKETFYDNLLEDTCVNNLSLSSILQTSDFEFNKDGISGESITAVYVCGSPEPTEHEVTYLNVDRPFYCLSLKDGFPLFANKITTLN